MLPLGIHFTLLLVLVGCTVSSSSFLLELAVGPRLKTKETVQHEKVKNTSTDTVKELVTKYGYPIEVYRITTIQGYIITLHRIPHGRKQTERKRPVVLLHPGLFGSPELFLFRGPQIDMPYLLAESGYDFWIINSRGNFYSKNHVSLNAETDTEYWKFSFHELGLFDLPHAIDFILDTTKQENLFLIGYSMGAAVGHIMLSEKPEYNTKIKIFVNLAPTVYLVHDLMPQFKLAFNLMPKLANILMQSYNIYEIFPRRQYTQNILTALCQNGARTQKLCLTLFFLIAGFDYTEFNTDLIPEIFKYFPDGTSVQSMLHLQQMYTTNKFKAYDFGSQINKITYNLDKPPDYNVTKNTAPMAIYYGDGDYLVTKEDCEYLTKQLPNVVGLFRVPFKNFNHMDFMWSTNVRQLLYDHINKLLNKYKQY